jgi:cytidyltransferase-like protein
MIHFFIFLILSTLTFTPCQAIDLSTVKSSDLRGKLIGYFVGSFDPIHKGHQNVIEKVLADNLCDYVFIYPVPGSDSHKKRSSFDIRMQMIEAVYGNNLRVLHTRMMPPKFQNYFKLSQPAFTGIVGSDVVRNYLANPKYNEDRFRFMRGIDLPEDDYTAFGTNMALKADSFIIALRQDDLLQDVIVNDYLEDRKIIGYVHGHLYDNVSSSKILKERNNHGKFTSKLAKSYVDQRVLDIMHRNRIYEGKNN